MGELIRVAVDCTDTDTGEQIWAQKFDRKLEDIFAIQDEISEGIVRSIEPEITRAEENRIRRKHPGELTAWELVHRARAIKNRTGLAYGTREDNEIALGYLQKAQELDPSSGDAHAALARVYWHRLISAWSQSPEQDRELAMQHAQLALEYDPGNWEAAGINGLISIFGLHDVDRGVELLRHGVSLNPSSSPSHHFLGCGLGFADRLDESVEHLNFALKLDPRTAGAAVLYSDMCVAALLSCNYEDAINFGNRSETADPVYIRGRQRLVPSYLLSGDRLAAENELAELCERQPGISLEYFRNTYPFKKQEHLDIFIDAYRELGIE